MNRQRLILFILLIVLIVAVAWGYFSAPRQKKTASLKHAPGAVSSPGKAPFKQMSSAVPPADNRILRLDLLDREQTTFKGYRRNLFKPVFVDELKVAKQKAAAIKPVQPVQPPVAPPRVLSEAEVALEAKKQKTENAKRELSKFIFKGFLRKDNVKTIFLSKDKTLLLVKKGDIIENRFKAVSITDQALTIVFTETGDEITIPLMENLNLRAVP